MKLTLTAALATLALAAPAFAGDAAKGEADFKKCKACHMIVAPDGTEIQKGGKTGPNLYGVVGRKAGSLEGFNYSNALVKLGEAGEVWTEEDIAHYVADPNKYVDEKTGDKTLKTKMTFKLTKGGEDMAAYLASVAPAPEGASN